MIGVYAITCTHNNRSYVGSSVDIAHRWRSHRSSLNKGNHHCVALQEDWTLYGERAFAHTTLKVCNEEGLEKYESVFMESVCTALSPSGGTISLSPIYNSSSVVSNPMRDKATAEKNIRSRGDSQSGVNGPGAKLNKEDILIIVRGLIEGDKPADLAAAFFITEQTVTAIRKGRTHKWVADEQPELWEELCEVQKVRKARVSRGSVGTVTLVHSNGIEATPQDLDDFCEEHGLKRMYLDRVLRGALIRYKGWRVKK